MATKVKKGEKEANPFSFKAFVSGGPQQSGDFASDEEDVQPIREVPPVKKPSKVKSKKAAAKVAKPATLPAVPDLFAQDDEPLAVPARSDSAAGPVPKKASDERANPFSFTSFVKRDSTPSVPFVAKGGGSSDDDWANSSGELASAPLPSRPSATTGLPSSRVMFSSSDDNDDDDSSVSNGVGLPAPPAARPSSSGRGTANSEHLLRQLEKLQEENTRLVAQLTAAEQKATAEKKRCQKLKKQLEVQQKREKEEAAVLEQAVQLVEKNLETSTIRAVKAEQTVEQLKQQLLLAQAQPASEKLHMQHAQQLAAIREKGEQASLKLVTTAQNAEKSIKELIGGVENLKFVAELLSTIDRFAEVPPGVD
ncbi:endosome-associated-trafficking regulator 1-like [Sycon ciliatum]|uniref:endosome-associated-trafficking regulator 1-like n=1 Tax=Sycon ciliatum TaxID=27933 RepID=UPI0031F619AD